MSEKIIFYDLPCKLQGKYKAWSPNTWNTRFALNFKGIPYETEWVEFPDVEALCKKIGAPATGQKDDGSPYYSVPTIYDPSTKSVVTDSFKIALYLDKQYPDAPKLFPHNTQALIHNTLETVGSVATPSFFLVIADIWTSLNEASQGYFRETREKKFAKKLEEITPEGSEQEEALWKQLDGALKNVGELIDLTGGPYIMGDTVSYADLLLAAQFIWVKRCWSGASGGDGETSQKWERFCGLDGGRWKTYAALLSKYEQVI